MLGLAFHSDPPPPEDTADALDPSVMRIQSQLADLAELRGIAMEVARALGQRVVAEARQPIAMDAADAPSDLPADEPPRRQPAARRDPADAFARASRVVRLTIALERKTDEAFRALQAGLLIEAETRRAQAPRRADAAARAEQARGDARIEEIKAVMSEIILAESESLAEARDLDEALDERLDADSAYENAADMPLREVLRRLCADLALAPDARGWQGDTWKNPDPAGRPRYSAFRHPRRAPFNFHRMTVAERDAYWTIGAPPPPCLNVGKADRGGGLGGNG